VQAEGVYEVRVKVKTLSEASKIIQILDEAGYRDVEMGPPRAPHHTAMLAKMAETVRGRVNRMILRAMHRLGALNREHAVDAERIVEEMKNDPESGGLVKCSHHEGVLTRTVAMIASSILAEKYGWVGYDPDCAPRRFWLTDKGVREVESNRG